MGDIMRKVYQIVFSFLNMGFVLLIGMLFIHSKVQTTTLLVNNLNREKQVNSSQIFKKEVVINITEVKHEETVKKEVEIIVKNKSLDNKKKQEEKDKTNTKIKETEENIVKEKIEQYAILSTLNGSLAAYGTDCKGCSTKTSSGYDISKSIYYEDQKYGKIRILAGDKSYPYGTIVNVKIDSSTQIKGIVLDRGSDIGIGKKFQFDLLFESQKQAYSFGSKKNVTFEILRLGY